jgi:hypothetical protein
MGSVRPDRRGRRPATEQALTVYDDETQTAETGPEAGWGDSIVGPAVTQTAWPPPLRL